MCSGPQKAVYYVVIIDVVSRDRARLVDAYGERALESPCARARNVERGDGTAGSAHEAVKHIARVPNVSRNRPRLVDAVLDCRKGALIESCARAGTIVRDD